MKTDVERQYPPRKARRRSTWLLMGLIGGVLFGWWLLSPPPLVGGGRPDSFAASWVKNRIYATVSPQEEQDFQRLTTANGGSWQNVFAEPIQSLEYYQSRHPMRPTPQRRTIVLQPIGDMNQAELKLLKDLMEYV